MTHAVLALTQYEFKTPCVKKRQVDINFYCLNNPNPKLFSVKTTVKPLNCRNLWVRSFAMSTTKVQLFWETEQKGDKNTIKVINQFVLTFSTAICEVSSINAYYTEVFEGFNSKTFQSLTFCPLFFRWFAWCSEFLLYSVDRKTLLLLQK